VSTFPLAADLLADQLDVATLQGVGQRRRLNLLRTFLPDATWAARPTDALLMEIARTERAIERADALTDDIRGVLEILRKS
jgi:hypothetical protein